MSAILFPAGTLVTNASCCSDGRVKCERCAREALTHNIVPTDNRDDDEAPLVPGGLREMIQNEQRAQADDDDEVTSGMTLNEDDDAPLVPPTMNWSQPKAKKAAKPQQPVNNCDEDEPLQITPMQW